MKSHYFLIIFIIFIVAIDKMIPTRMAAQIPESLIESCNVIEFGATGNGIEDDTPSIQDAIDSCHQSGGGTVYFPAGTYLSGSIHLKSNIALFLDHGATLLASPDDQDFDPYEELGFENDADHETSFFHFSFIWGEDVERIAILGTGIIDGNRSKRGGPKPIALKRCKSVTIKDVTILNAPNYAISMLGTDYVNIDGVTILNGYCDGIDPDCCRHVRISNCHIESWDDAIVPKSSFSLGHLRPTEYLTITNCQLASNCNAFKLGTESGGDFKYITLSNCIMFNRSFGRPPTSGISLESVDGAHIDGITINNISMNNVRVPIFLRLGNRGRDMEQPIPGSLKNVIISNITATAAEKTCPLTGIPGYNIENITLQNIKITFKGGGTSEQTKIDVPELIEKYPSATMFPELPAYGFYMRHVSDIKLRDIHLSLASPDLRHALFCEDVDNIEIDSFNAGFTKGSESSLKLNQVKKASIRNCRPRDETDVFLKISGKNSERIALWNNDFRGVKKIIEKGEEVSEDAVNLQFYID
jgi:hypothetical protein